MGIRPTCQCAIVRGVVTESSEAYELSNVVETALARALVLAAEAKRWDVVMQIADELQGRRVGRLMAPTHREDVQLTCHFVSRLGNTSNPSL